MILLRRRHRSDPLEITTAPAPVLGGPHVDVNKPDAPVAAAAPVPTLQVEGSVSFDMDDDTAAALRELVAVHDDDRPPMDRGTCYHDLHFEHDGRRFGALIHPHQHSAALLPCPYLGRAGR